MLTLMQGERTDIKPLMERFLALWAPGQPSECWPWRGNINRYGYGRIKNSGRQLMAHRLAYEHLVEPIPEDQTIDHLCRNKICLNPAHMEVVSRAENSRRKRGHYQTKACIRGHEWTPANTYSWVDRTGLAHRRCRACDAAKRRR